MDRLNILAKGLAGQAGILMTATMPTAEEWQQIVQIMVQGIIGIATIISIFKKKK